MCCFLRRPQHPAAYFPPVDVQALPPLAWCARCGGEVYFPGHRLCRRCRKGGVRYGECPLSQSLSGMQAGEKPQSLQ